MPNLTVITPIALHHRALFAQCEVSVQRQTVPVLHYAMIDQDGKGPGYIRNRLLAKVTTEYVTFLDADDMLEPDFAEVMLSHQRRGRYTFSDWYQDGARIKADRKPWCTGNFHLISAVLPTDLARAVGGFDEMLPAMEDTDFWFKIMVRGVCGLRVPRPLVHYRKDGGRAFQFHQSQVQLDLLRAEMSRRYGGIRMGCCGNNTDIPEVPAGAQLPGDVLARALWGGNRVEMGRVTGRHYPRTGNGKLAWVDPRDVRAAPNLWQEVGELDEDGELPDEDDLPLRGAAGLAQALMDRGKLKPAPVQPPAPPPPIEVHPTPDFDRVRQLTQEKTYPVAEIQYESTFPEGTKLVSLSSGATIDSHVWNVSDGSVALAPTFVKPVVDYPSYRDFWQLVELAGYSAATGEGLDLHNPDKLYIFTGPEGIPDCSQARARTIFWQLEYVGDYTNQPNHRTVSEIWSSEPAHAKQHGYKYVMLGSHPKLNPAGRRQKPQYDITMLAYMTQRREAIQKRLMEYRWPENYPGHDGEARHKVLRATRLMLHAHQHDAPAMTPLRYALAAAYRLPLLSEHVPDSGPFHDAIMWADYDSLPSHARLFLEDKLEWDYDALYYLLCVEHPFAKCVEEALKA